MVTKVKQIIMGWLELPLNISNCVSSLLQIYGEINRIRLIMSENSKVGNKIEKFDRDNNKYIPFFDSEDNFDKFKAIKSIQK